MVKLFLHYTYVYSDMPKNAFGCNRKDDWGHLRLDFPRQNYSKRGTNFTRETYYAKAHLVRVWSYRDLRSVSQPMRRDPVTGRGRFQTGRGPNFLSTIFLYRHYFEAHLRIAEQTI